MDKILQQIGTFLGRKFSKIYTIFNDKYNELDNKKVDKEEGKELMPSPEGASDTVFLSETGWREVNTDKIRTHVISISIPFDSAWDFNGAQEITLEEGDYDRDEADSFIYDYFRYNNPNVVIRNTNTTAQSAQKGYHTVWKVALDTIAEGRALRLYLDIPENLSFTMAPEADSARFTRYCILLYLSQDEGNQTYILNNIGILPNGTDSFIPRKYLDGKLSDITSSYLPLSGGLMTGNIAFPDGKGLGSAVGQSDLLVRSGNTVKLGSAGFSARLYAENPVVREGLEGMFTMYDTSNLDIDKPFVTDLRAVYDAEGKNTQSIAVDLYNPVAKSATKVYMELLPVTDTNMGLMTPSYKTALDRLIPSSGESLSIYGTPASTWQLTLGTGPKLKNSGGIFELRDNSDNAYTDLILNNITIKGNVTQEGSSFITKAETVEVSDNILLLNRGEVGSGVTKGISGIQVDRGALADYQFIFDESDDRFKVGVEGDLWPVILRNNESDLSDKFFLSWDASLKRAVTTNIVPETGLLFSGGVSNHPEYDITVVATGSGSIRFGALQANTPWSCTIGYNLNTRDVPSADILDFATSLNAYRYDKPSVLNMIYFDTYLSPNSIEPYGASSISLTTGSGDDLIHTKGGQNYIIYDSSNLDVEGLIQNYTLSGNIIGTPKTTRIKGTTIPSGSDFINNFRELIWGTNDSTTWIVPFRSNSADSGLGGAYAANLGWSLGDTHAYISVSYRNDLRSVIIGGGNEGKIKWFEQVAFKSDINNLSTVYYPYSGRGHMTIREDGRPIFTNNQGILFNTTSGFIEGIYVTTNNHLNIGGIKSNNIPVDIYNDLNITRIVDRATNFSLLIFTNEGTEDTQITHIGAEHGTTRIRSGLFNLVHDRGGTLYTVFDGYNFSRNLDTISINSSFDHLPMMAAQIKTLNATTDRGYPTQEAGSLVVIPGTYHGSSQIYGTFNTNRWFVRGGSNSPEDPTAHTSWKELATTNHLSGYLPLTGGTMTGNIMFPTSEVYMVQTLKSTSNYGAPIRWMVGNETRAMIGYHTTGGDGSAGAMILTPTNPGSSPWENGNGLFLDRAKIYFNGQELATTKRLSNYLPLTGGTLTGSLNIGDSSQNAYNYIRIHRNNYTFETTVSEGSGILSLESSNSGVTPTKLEISLGGHVFINGEELAKVSQIPSMSGYLPLSGGTLTRTTAGPVLSLKNTSSNKEAYMDFYKGDVRCGYIGASASNSEDMYLNAYGSRNVIIGTAQGFTRLESGNNNLIHRRNGTDYTILDTYNIYSLTIQFNGSTNTIYAPNEAKTVNITPAAIGAAAVGHTHVMSDIRGLSLAWSSITGKPETATRWPSWSEVTNKPINPSYSFGGNNDSITTAQFLTHLQNLGAFSTGFGIYRGSWSYMANQSITDTGVGVIHLAGSTVEVIGNSASNCTIRVTVPTTSGNGTTKRIYVYCNNGDDYKPGWFAVARTDELTWNSISGKPSTFTPSSHTHTKSQITDFPSSMPASDVYAWAKASSKPSYSWSEITSKPSTFTPSSHTHPLSDISDLQASWDALLKAAPSAYVTRWPSWSEVTSKPSFATVATSGSYNDLSNKPSIPSAETAATIMSKINSQSEITFSKHVVCSAGAGTSSTSDIRFKNNITSLAPVLSHVLGSPGFFYTWKDEDEVLVGTSAQYWEGRITGLVREINDKSKTKTFSYERYTVILQEALKEEHMLREAEKEEYRKEICSLREELEDLKKLIQKLL